ncbi:MAG: adenosine kinase, partial [Bacteroidaceae bacterium]|nr:adenosine kinase [Bacteroidaceae bacterium]
FGTHLGVAAELHATHLQAEMFEGYDFFHIEGYLTQDHSLIDRALTLATAAGMTTSIDLASYNIVAADHEFFEYLLRKVDIVFANEEEAKAFTGKEPEAALDELCGICKIAVVKVGAKGSLIGQGAERVVVPARKVTPIDTTAAGDFFAAGFLYGLAKGYRLQQCGEIGTLLASEVLQVMGTVLTDDTWLRIRSEVARYES